MIRKSFLLILLVISCISCQEESNPVKNEPSKEELLTGNNSRNWQVTYRSTDRGETRSSCKISSIQNTDNYFIFKKGGTFIYDNGTITENPDEDSCGDLADLFGTWEFTSNQDSLLVIVNRKLQDGDTVSINEVRLLKGKILSLAAQELKISQPMINPVDTVIFKGQ